MKHCLSISRLDLLVCRLDALIDYLQAQGAAAFGGRVNTPKAPKLQAVPLSPSEGLAALQKAERLSRERFAIQSLLSAAKERHNLQGKELLKDAVLRQLSSLQGILETQGPRRRAEQDGDAPVNLTVASLTPAQLQALQADISRLQLELVGLYDALGWIKASLVEVALSAEVGPLADEVLGKSRGTCTRYRCPQAAQCA